MLRSIYPALPALVITVSSHAQSLEWATAVGGAGQEIGYAVCSDSEGSVITVGTFVQTVDLDPGPGVFNVSTPNSSDVFIQKLDGDGNFVWGGAFGNTGADLGLGVTTDASNNVIVTGKVSGTVDIDPTPGVFTVSTANTTFDVVVVKLSSAGAFLWGTILGGNNNDQGNAVAVDGSGNILVAGVIGAAADLDPGTGVSTFGGNGAQDAFVVKLDANGDFVWGAAFGGTGNDIAHGVAARANGDVHVTGEFRSTADFDPGVGLLPLTSLGDGDIFALKLSASGALAWARRAGGTSLERAKSVAVDLNGATSYTGVINSVSDMDPGAGVFNLAGSFMEQAFVWRLDINGDFSWAWMLNGFLCSGNSIRSGAQNELYVTGFFGGSMDIDPGTGTTTIASAGASDIFLISYGPTGNLLWGSSIGSAQNDMANGVGLTPLGKILLTGEFRQTIDMDPGAATTLISPAGGQDSFTAKYGKPDCAGVFVSLTAILEGAYDPGGFLAMDDALRSAGLVPLQEPYSAMGFTLEEPGITTSAALAFTGSGALVDWVLVELRDPSLPSSVLRRRAALMQRDGDVVALDGVSPVGFCIAPGDFYVALRHRNHLGVMTAAPITIGAASTAIDLTLAATPVFGVDAMHELDGLRMLWPGNVLPNNVVSYVGQDNDRDPILVRVGGNLPTNTVNGYWPEDVNLDGVVKYVGSDNDRDPILLVIGGNTPTNTRTEQLP